MEKLSLNCSAKLLEATQGKVYPPQLFFQCCYYRDRILGIFHKLKHNLHKPTRAGVVLCISVVAALLDLVVFCFSAVFLWLIVGGRWRTNIQDVTTTWFLVFNSSHSTRSKHLVGKIMNPLEFISESDLALPKLLELWGTWVQVMKYHSMKPNRKLGPRRKHLSKNHL